MITLNPFWAGLVKGVLGVVVLAVVSYLGDVSHLTGLGNLGTATVIAGLFSGIESLLKAKSGGTTALFGAVKVA